MTPARSPDLCRKEMTRLVGGSEGDSLDLESELSAEELKLHWKGRRGTDWEGFE